MSVKIALLRGINVGGNNKLPMKELVSSLEKIGCETVRTYIQSGNVVYRGKPGAAEIAEAIKSDFGLAIPVIVLTRQALKKLIRDCPFKGAADQSPKNVHLYFLDGKPARGARDEFNAIKSPDEDFAFGNKVLYLHTPEGFLSSAIAPKAERILKVQHTARNWNTVSKIHDLSDAI